MLRHAREPVDGQPIENTFLDIDDATGEYVGACTIYCDENAALFPGRPFQVRLQLEGDPLSPQLLGAAIARGREICASSGKLSRLYTRCAPDDVALMDSLEAMGFQDNDGLACAEFEKQKLYCVEANARARIPYVLKLFEKMGFRQEELLMRYPGVDINP